MKKLVFALCTLALGPVAAPATADFPLIVHPSDPTTDLQIVLGISGYGNCPWIGEPSVEEDGKTVFIPFRPDCGVLSPPPYPFQLWAPIGPLTPGKWTLNAGFDDQTILASTTVRVRSWGSRIEVVPAHPTIDDDVTLLVSGFGSCVFADPPIFDDRTIQVTAGERGICDPPPPSGPYEIPVDLGPLVEGLWEVEFYSEPYDTRLVATTEIEVIPSDQCATGGQTLCLQEDRFRVEADWKTAEGATGHAQAVGQTPDSGLFWFFDEDNLELLVKVLDGCETFDTYWVFASGLTNVGVTLTVTDLLTSDEWSYTTSVGETFEPVLDTQAFSTCPSD